MEHTLEVKQGSVGHKSKTETKTTAMQVHQMAGEILNTVEGFHISTIEKLTVLSAAKAIIEAIAITEDFGG